MEKYNISVDFGTQGYSVRGGLWRVLWEVWKEPNAQITVSKP